MKGKSIIGIVALALVGILAIAYVGFSVACNNWNPAKWVKSETEIQQPETKTWGGAIDNVGNKLSAEKTYEMPAAMAFYAATDSIAEIAAAEDPSVTVTCTHNLPYNNVFVDWTIEYPSGASATDVVTVTPTSDGSLTAKVSCTGPFDTQLKLKATLRGAPEKSATCTIDYVKRVESVSNAQVGGTDFGEGINLNFVPQFGIGSIAGNLRISSLSLYLNEDFMQQVKSYLTFDIAFNAGYKASNVDVIFDRNVYFTNDIENFTYAMFIDDFDNYDTEHKNAIYYAWWTAYQNYGKEANFTVDIGLDLVYNEVVINGIKEYDLFNACFLTGETNGATVMPDLTLNTNIAL